MRKTFSVEERRSIYKKYDGHCAYCGCNISYREMVVDHFMAFSKDGSNNIDNLFPTCNLCNAVKFNMSIENFRKKIMGLYLDDLPKIKMLSKYYKITPKNSKFLFYFETFNKEKTQ